MGPQCLLVGLPQRERVSARTKSGRSRGWPIHPVVCLEWKSAFTLQGFWKPLEKPFNLRAANLNSVGIAIQPLVIDLKAFDRAHYDFNFAGREFLGKVRTLVFDVAPRKHAGDGRFVGRIWVEDVDYNVVRFNGTYKGVPHFTSYVHFDSWRANVNGRQWLPAYVYLEESDLVAGFRHVRIKGETTVWGYGLQSGRKQQELTDIIADSSIDDRSETAPDYSPVQRQRLWERQAEDNVIERLQKAGLVAPGGDVSKVLETVINNLEVTNNLNIEPPVRARVLLTSQLETFTVGHTIVISRGLVDVLPDEASLAMMLAHELAHIVLGHQLETKYAFSDRLQFPDWEAFRRLQLKRDRREEDEADDKAMALLKNSPYADRLANVGLFLRELSNEAPRLSSLLSPHLGNRLVKGRELPRLAELMRSAPPLRRQDVAQVAALPLGSRIKLDPWDAHIEMMKTAPTALLAAREKRPFEVTPVIQNLTRKTEPSQKNEVVVGQGGE